MLTSFSFPVVWFYQSSLVWELSSEVLLFILVVLRWIYEGNIVKHERAPMDLQEREIPIWTACIHAIYKNPNTLPLPPFYICHF